jgi:NitT/TauT family transport system substrate-binding protein
MAGILVGLFLLPSLWAAPAAPLKKVSLCLPTNRAEFLHMVALHALDAGMFKRHGLDVKIRFVHNGNKSDWADRQAFVTKPEEIDRGVANLVAASRKGCDFGGSMIERYLGDAEIAKKVRPVFVGHYGEGYDTHLVVALDSPARTLKDLKGKVIETGGFPTYLATVAALEAHGLSTEDVAVKNDTKGTENVASLYRGKTDAMTAYLPMMSLALASGRVRVLEENIVKKFVGPRVPHSMLVVSDRLLKRAPTAVQAFREAVLEAQEFLNRNPAELFYIRNKHRELAHNKRRLTSAMAERAATFVGQVNMTDAAKNGDQLYCDLKDMARIVGGRGYQLADLNLSEWLSLKNTPACAEQSRKVQAERKSKAG